MPIKGGSACWTGFEYLLPLGGSVSELQKNVTGQVAHFLRASLLSASGMPC